ncbi:MAG TPA: DUF3995 domain-containing protein [Steroidobacteraceae bacterium]|jgi:hypothetical protein|nr:DUF3995 domain-containing protein [Steroidobacteraceae bacterium]
MNPLLPLSVSLIFVVLALWHFYMASRPSQTVSGAVPSAGGKPLFVPGRVATVAVGVALLVCAALVAATGGVIPRGLPVRMLSLLSYALAAGLLLRAVGEFKYLGFFKRVRGTRFARLDTLLYSPLCLALAVGVTWVAYAGGAMS